MLSSDIILGHDWLRAHGLNFLYDSDAVCLCVESRGGPPRPGRRVHQDLTLDSPATVTRLSPAEACGLLGTVGLGEAPTFGASNDVRRLELPD